MDNYSAYLLGQFLGMLLAALPLYLFGLLAGLLARSSEPEERAMYAAIGAWIMAYVLAGFGFARGVAFNFAAGLLYIPAAVIAFVMLKRHYSRLRRSSDDGLERTFD